MPLSAQKIDRSRSQDAFTLIEMIAVVAVIAVLAALLVPRWIKRIDLKVARAERSNLVTISNALVSQVSHYTAIPDETSWANCVAQGSSIPVSKVSSNTRRYSRLYYYETGAAPGPGYTQPSQSWQGFAAEPQNLRAVVVSLLGGASLNAANCPDPDGGPLNAASFNELWNLADNSRPTAAPWDSWNGDADDFLVQRVNYRPLFHHLVLVNRETNDLPRFMIDGVICDQGTLARAQGVNHTGWGAYYLRGTTVDLCDPTTASTTKYVLRQDICFVWENGRWRAEIAGDPEGENLGDVFTKTARDFLEVTRYATKDGSQQSIVTAMYNFMLSYTYWANQCPRFTWSGASSEENVAEYKVLRWIGGNSDGMLDGFSRSIIAAKGKP